MHLVDGCLIAVLDLLSGILTIIVHMHRIVSQKKQGTSFVAALPSFGKFSRIALEPFVDKGICRIDPCAWISLRSLCSDEGSKIIREFPVLSLRLDLLRKAYHISPKGIVAAGLPFKGKCTEMKGQEHYKKNGFLHYLFSSKLIAKPPPLAMVI